VPSSEGVMSLITFKKPEQSVKIFYSSAAAVKCVIKHSVFCWLMKIYQKFFVLLDERLADI
jgi:hypothetical protein